MRALALVALPLLVGCKPHAHDDARSRAEGSGSASVDAGGGAGSTSASTSRSTTARDAGPPSEFLAFQGKLTKGGTFRLALERRGAELTGEFSRDATSSDVSLTGTMKDATHFALTEAVSGGERASTVDGELGPGGTVRATWREPRGAPLVLTGGPNAPFAASQTTFTETYAGTLGTKIRVRMKLAKAASGAISGVYRYTRSKEDLKLAGKVSPTDGRFELEESTADGKVTGRFEGVFLVIGSILGRWTSPDGARSFLVRLEDSEGAYPEIVKLDGGGEIVPEEHFDAPAKHCTFTSIVPQVTRLASKEAEASANRGLRALADRAGNGALTKKDCDGATADEPFTLETEYVVGAKRGRFIALHVTSFAFLGGVHGSHNFSCAVLDVAKGAVVRLASLLTPSGRASLEAMVNKKLAADAGVEKLSDAGFFEDHVPLGDDPDLCVDDKGLAVRFHDYEVAPYAMGEPEAHFASAEVRKLFAPNDVTGGALP